MTGRTSEEGASLRDVLQPLRRRWWLPVAAAVIAGAASFLVVRGMPPEYEAHATLLIGRVLDNPNPVNNDVWVSQELGRTYADIARRPSFADDAARSLGLARLPDYSVTLVEKTQLIEVVVRDTDPVRARDVAAVLARQVVELSPGGADAESRRRQDFLTRQLDEVETRIEATEEQIRERQAQLAEAVGVRQIDELQSIINGLQDKLTTLQRNYADLLANTTRGAANSMRLMREPTVPVRPVGPNRVLIVSLAILAAAVVGAGGAYLLDVMDNALRTPEDVDRSLGLPTLASVPFVDEGRDLVPTDDVHSPAMEAFRVLRTNLQFASVDRPLRQLVVTSASPGEGKSLVVANLGAALAQLGKRVVIVDCDLRRPRQHRIFGLVNNVGMTSLLLDEVPPDSIFQETSRQGLRVVTSGPLPPLAVELLASERLRVVLERLQAEADVLLVDGPPVTIGADAAVLATRADGVLLVVDHGATRRDMAVAAGDALRQVQARLLGVVINRVPAGGSAYSYAYEYDDQGSEAGLPANGRWGLRRWIRRALRST